MVALLQGRLLAHRLLLIRILCHVPRSDFAKLFDPMHDTLRDWDRELPARDEFADAVARNTLDAAEQELREIRRRLEGG